jgi:hypothetical protein
MKLAWIGLLSSALGGTQELAETPDWQGTTVARSLHPVRVHPMADWQRAMSLAMAGPQASPLFRSTSSRMDCYWRLSAVGPAPFLSESFRDVVVDHALLGASLGWEATLRSTLDRSEEMSVLRQVITTASGPRLSWTGGEEGGEIRVDEHSRRGRMAMVDLEEGRPALPVSQRPPPAPQFRLGTGMRMVADEDDDDLAESLEIQTEPALSAYAHGSHLGLDHFRMEILWQNPGTARQELAWEMALRERMHPFVSWVSSLQGSLDGEIERARSSLEWHPPQVQPWVLRTGVLIRPDEGAPIRIEMAIQARTRWHLPQTLDRWPLGMEPGAEGPYWPVLPDRSPNELVELVEPRDERVAGQ